MDGLPYQAIIFPTPPVPEYSSGHSTFSAAGAEILKLFTESDDFGASVTFPAGSSKFESGAVPATDVTLQWATFSEAADQAGFSRRVTWTPGLPAVVARGRRGPKRKATSGGLTKTAIGATRTMTAKQTNCGARP